jgi:hypothetical protein
MNPAFFHKRSDVKLPPIHPSALTYMAFMQQLRQQRLLTDITYDLTGEKITASQLIDLKSELAQEERLDNISVKVCDLNDAVITLCSTELKAIRGQEEAQRALASFAGTYEAVEPPSPEGIPSSGGATPVLTEKVSLAFNAAAVAEEPMSYAGGTGGTGGTPRTIRMLGKMESFGGNAAEAEEDEDDQRDNHSNSWG